MKSVNQFGATDVKYFRIFNSSWFQILSKWLNKLVLSRLRGLFATFVGVIFNVKFLWLILGSK